MPEDKIIDGVLYAVIGVIFNKDGKILMFKREGEEWETGWEPVKGGIHLEETEEEAVRREIKEEANLDDVKVLGKLEKYNKASKPWKGGRLDIKSRVFACLYQGGEVRMGEPEHVDYKWMPVEEAKNRNWLNTDRLKIIEKSYELFKEETQ